MDCENCYKFASVEKNNSVSFIRILLQIIYCLSFFFFFFLNYINLLYAPFFCDFSILGHFLSDLKNLQFSQSLNLSLYSILQYDN